MGINAENGQGRMGRRALLKGGVAAVAAAVVTGIERTPARAQVDHITMQPGETRFVPRGSVVIGDIVANGFRLFDDRAETGLMTVIKNPAGAEIHAPYGANVMFIPGEEREVMSEIIGNKILEMMETGCKPGGCEWIKVSRDP